MDICPADQSKQEQSSIHTISIVLESGWCSAYAIYRHLEWHEVWSLLARRTFDVRVGVCHRVASLDTYQY